MNKDTFLKETFTHLNSLPRRADEPGYGPHSFCKYQTQDGLQCAIGRFIPQGHPALEFVGSVHSLLENYGDLWDVLKIDGMDAWDATALMLAVQKTHDDEMLWTDTDGFLLKDYEMYVCHVTETIPEAEDELRQSER